MDAIGTAVICEEDSRAAFGSAVTSTCVDFRLWYEAGGKCLLSADPVQYLSGTLGAQSRHRRVIGD